MKPYSTSRQTRGTKKRKMRTRPKDTTRSNIDNPHAPWGPYSAERRPYDRGREES